MTNRDNSLSARIQRIRDWYEWNGREGQYYPSDFEATLEAAERYADVSDD